MRDKTIGNRGYRPGLYGVDHTRGYKPKSDRRYKIERTNDLLHVGEQVIRRPDALRVEGMRARLWSGRDIWSGEPASAEQIDFVVNGDPDLGDLDDLTDREIDDRLGAPPDEDELLVAMLIDPVADT